ncbi:MAG: hypothetical protein H6868_03970 [Rhodospirillales bacterium]|nr:hypothetical protein [Rhodospirillales bacterium]
MAKASQNKMSGNKDEIWNALDNASATPVDFRFSPAFPVEKTCNLLASIEHDLTADEPCLVHFTSAYTDEGARSIAFEMAYAAAVQSNKRVLFLDMGAGIPANARGLKTPAVLSLDSFAQGTGKSSGAPFTVVEDISLFYAFLSNERLASAGKSFFTALFGKLRTMFDMIVICSEGALGTGPAKTFAGLSDSNVIVIEAERTRVPVVKELLQIIESSGGKVTGTVLNKRRHYIPLWLYRLLFKSS